MSTCEHRMKQVKPKNLEEHEHYHTNFKRETHLR